MINKKLDDIIKDIEEIKKVFNSTDYFKKLEEVIDKQNNHNKELELKINNLQSKIDKAIEFVESMKYCGQEDYFYDNKSEDPCGNDNTFDDSKNKLLDILKENK